MCPNWRSSGVATEEAIVSGLAPGNPALTEIVGKSICGSGETGKRRYAAAPAKRIATTSSVVATGRRMNGSDMLMPTPDAVRLAATDAAPVPMEALEDLDAVSARTPAVHSLASSRSAAPGGRSRDKSPASYT